MANVSSVEIRLSGSGENIVKAIEDIVKFYDQDTGCVFPKPADKTLPEVEGYGSLAVYTFDVDSVSITINGEGRYVGPYGYFKELVKTFNLSGSYHDAEPGYDFFYTIEAENGKITHDEEYPFLSPEHIEHRGIDYFVEEYEWIPGEPEWEEEYADKLGILTQFIPMEKLEEAWGI